MQITSPPPPLSLRQRTENRDYNLRSEPIFGIGRSLDVRRRIELLNLNGRMVRVESEQKEETRVVAERVWFG